MSDGRPEIEPVAISPGIGSFLFNQFPGGVYQPLIVHYFWPKTLEEDAPIVFVMHGLLRDGERYRDGWKQLADKHSFLLIAPEFHHESYPDVEDYNLAGLLDQTVDNKFSPRQNWAFARIERLFEAIQLSTPFVAERFGIYGHSAGAQFVHRLVLFYPEASFEFAVAANAGWYTLPCRNTRFPYGLAEAPVCNVRLARALKQRLIILLGEEDNDERHHSLRRSPEALEQGEHRLERGHFFVETGRLAAERLAVPFGWKIETVPKAKHCDSQMSTAAARCLIGR